MRSKREMLDLIVGVAAEDERIRAVTLTGSRANPDVPPDMFQDFDVNYYVRDVAPFWENTEWIRRFGEIMMVQMPESMEEPPPSNDGCFVYLMQFTDGNRIDLAICPLTQIAEEDHHNPIQVLLDKDGIIELAVPPGERYFLPTPPTPQSFADCCNEFWWVSLNVAKGLWRQQIIYAHRMLDEYMRAQLMRMLIWHIGSKTGFARNPGKAGKYFEQYLESDLWQLLLNTYAPASTDATWEALFAICDLFRQIALPLAQEFDLAYPTEDDRRVSAYLRHIRALPGDATEIYE
jgi:aminoglycoside 6-adenylyltransferase